MCFVLGRAEVAWILNGHYMLMGQLGALISVLNHVYIDTGYLYHWSAIHNCPTGTLPQIIH